MYVNVYWFIFHAVDLLSAICTQQQNMQSSHNMCATFLHASYHVQFMFPHDSGYFFLLFFFFFLCWFRSAQSCSHSRMAIGSRRVSAKLSAISTSARRSFVWVRLTLLLIFICTRFRDCMRMRVCKQHSRSLYAFYLIHMHIFLSLLFIFLDHNFNF